MKMPWIVAVSCLILSLVPNSASAQLRQGDTRLSIDADLLSVSWVKLVPDRERPARRPSSIHS